LRGLLLRYAFLVAEAVQLTMMQQNRGVILNTSAIDAIEAEPAVDGQGRHHRADPCHGVELREARRAG
jgi:hypothetical protein